MASQPKNKCPAKLYDFNVNRYPQFSLKLGANVYAMIDHKDGIPKEDRYVIITRESGSLICHCGITDCLHIVQAIKRYADDIDTGPTTIDPHTTVWDHERTRRMFGVYCPDTKTYSIVKKSSTGDLVKCLTCKNKTTICNHVSAYRKYDPAVYKSPVFKCVSYEPIPYVLAIAEQQIYVQSPPKDLLPQFKPSLKCVHGHLYDSRSPVKHGWITSRDHISKIHDARQSKPCTVYYRPTVGDCKCRQSYDGRQDLILNLDNTNLYTYAFLFDYMHFTQEANLPLAAYFRAINRSRENSPGELMKEHMREKLRLAYNCFIRLLDFDFLKLYSCSVCKDNVKVLIIDGIQMGCRQHKMPPKPSRPSNSVPIKEVDVERRYVKIKETRNELATYACLSYARIKTGEYLVPTPMPDDKFKKLLLRLKRDAPHLCAVIEEAGPTCPLRLQKVIGELSRGNPTCGVFQIAGTNGEVNSAYKVLRHIARGDHGQFHLNGHLLDKTCPSFKDLIKEGLEGNHFVFKLLDDLLDKIRAPFNTEIPSDENYAAPTEYDNIIEYLPNLGQLRGKGSYGADKSKGGDSVDCRKTTQTTPTLTSGLFTYFCPHGICLGFQLLDSPESPRVPFDILVRRFRKMPSLIIYDNACALHLYCLKREPKRFMNTRFMVDRMHRKNHNCTEGYCMETYSSDAKIKALNSQTCEQANAHLRRLATSLAYMTPENAICHVKVFLAIRNRDKKHNLHIYVDEQID